VSPQKKSSDVVEKILSVALDSPSDGVATFSRRLKNDFNFSVSPPTVLKYLKKEGLGSVKERFEWFLHNKTEKPSGLTIGQRRAVRKFYPRMIEEDKKSDSPGQKIVHDYFVFGKSRGYILNYAIDYCSCYVVAEFGYNQRTSVLKFLEYYIFDSLLSDYIEIIYNRQKVHFACPECLSGGGGACSCIKDNFSYRGLVSYLFKGKVRQKFYKKKISFNGFSEAFKNEFYDQFLKNSNEHKKALEKSSKMEEIYFKGLNAELDLWLKKYNSRPISGFPCFGKSPKEIIESSIKK
jgi:hypothetical protein